jgi:multiple sugar transport system ATP-binding protein
MNGVQVAGVVKRFGEVTALADVSLAAAEGELLVIVGPSGCGKSTLLRCIAGLEAVDAGTISIAGRDVTRVRPGLRNVSMVFQSYALFPHMTVAENIGFGLAVREEPRREVQARVAEASRLVGVTHLLARRPYQLSGGERQRVALARAIVREPDAYLLDEPLSNLDAGARMEMRTELRRLHGTVGATTIHVTHDQVEALTLGDRVAVLDAGTLQQVGTPDEVYRRPRNRFVAGFLGVPRMNFLEPDQAQVHAPGVTGVTVGVRAEHIRLDGDVVDRVELVEVAGADAYVHLASGLVATTDAEARPAPGDEVRVRIRPEDVHLFDEATGERVGPA